MHFQLCKLYNIKLKEDCEGWTGKRSDKRKIASRGMRFLILTAGHELFVLLSVSAQRTILYRTHRVWHKEHLWNGSVHLEFVFQVFLNVI
jgi:hypothetical protein